ncbi:MAG TPA: FkbM family methyltransferase [Vicinamibacterales bacterium]|nr:FkbM family methyltransferase [Vicinamibacterales bacterium]
MDVIAYLRRAARLLPTGLRWKLFSWRYGYSPWPGRAAAPPWTRDGDVLRIDLDGVRFVVPARWVGRLAYQLAGNAASREEARAFARASRQHAGALLFDVGAAHGLYSLAHCAAHAANRAVLFEPAPPLVEEGRDGIALNGCTDRCEIRHVAVSDAPGRCGGRLDELGYAQILPPGEGTFSVPLVRLDDEVERIGAPPALLKIDVEGHELRVLRGAKDLLARYKPLLFLEIHADLLRLRQEGPDAIVSLLEPLGYRFYAHHGAPLSGRRVARTLHAILRVQAR